MRLRINVTGIVQGVGFRPFVYRLALNNHLRGYVLNRGDAGVKILVEGPKSDLQPFLRDLREKKPPLAQIHSLSTKTSPEKDKYERFTIHESSKGGILSGSVIPPDIAICAQCLKELRRIVDPRYNYFFLTCTDCGPRFTLIAKSPYDRENTTMREFPMCSLCQKDYSDPANRRFHAQTLACPKCGPKAYLTTRDGLLISHQDPVQEAGRLLSEGAILAIKGYGGFHLSASAINEKTLKKMREAKHRKQKPFAIMARSLEAVKTFAEINSKEEELLNSYARPIVLLNKNDNYHFSKLVAPGLHNIGTMLPYSGLHYMLFDQILDEAFVMTSANPPNQPIIKDNKEALKTLGNTVDYFLFHNRKIAYRCDDSVTRVHGNEPSLIRRSRGYAPAPIVLKERSRRCMIGLGGELNNTCCVLLENKAFISQHIGDVENVETRAFLEEAMGHLIRLTNSQPEAIACDLHPKFTTTNLAQELAKKNDWPVIRVQHHHAHVAALMLEHSIDEILGIVCDGYGYGTDGAAWGGEILFCTRQSTDFKRIAHLEKQPLVGGDVATASPLRIATAILSKSLNPKDWLVERSRYLPYGELEAEIIIRKLESADKIPQTTSCGRVLDAVAAVLGICHERTYEGEPAIKLESAARKGKNTLKMKPIINENVLDTTNLILEIFEKREKSSRADLAYSAHSYLAEGLASLAVEKAQEEGIKTIGFSGGAACNKILSLHMKKIVEDSGLGFLTNIGIPPGDGGLSFGQTVVGGFF